MRFKKVFTFRTCVSFLSEIRLGVVWLQLRERTRYWCRNQQGALSDQLLSPKRNCREIAAEELLGNCKVRKVFAKKKENGPDDESAHFGPAQEYERVSRRK